MPSFSTAHNFTINNGQFTDHSTTNILSGPSGIDILLKASCPEAAHDAAGREYSPRCFPGTRKQYIEDTVQWGVPALGGTSTPLYWMKGPAGVGKSAIAQTCAERLREMEKLGATFFFSINGQKKPEKFFLSIAYQLSTIFPSYRDLLDNKLRHDKTLVNKTMRSQFRYLIEEPLRELASQGNRIGERISVIVDGLDECEGQSAQHEIIDIVAGAAPDRTFPLCWAFFSRAEPHIEAAFATPSVAPYCHKVILPISRDADGEIELYLRNSFENILQRRNASMSSQWPSAQDIRTLVGAAGGLFIYATTVIRFVDHPGSLELQKRLRVIIEIILNSRASSSTDAPFAALDAFYTLILQRIPTEIYRYVHLLLALMCQCVNLGAILGANSLGMSKDEFETVCNHASAVVYLRDPGKGLKLDSIIDTNCTSTQIWQDVLGKLFTQVRFELGGALSFYHKSFEDFLLDPARSGAYCVKTSEALVNYDIKMCLGYDQHYCWQGSELILAPGVTDSTSSLSYPYTNELVNSLIKAGVYTVSGYEDTYSFSALRVGFGAMVTNCDFRKRLYVYTYLWSCARPFPHPTFLWGCDSRTIQYPGTWICWISLAQFNVTEFKSMVKQREKAKIIGRYHSSWSSTIKHIFGENTRERFESAVYRIGYGEKSVFWYWEINYELGHYREFQTVDLAEGERRFREEDFASWPSTGFRF